MEIKLVLSGLDCANCALELERNLNKIDIISNVSVNFMTQKINFECMIAGEKLSGSFVTDDENGKSFILSKHKEKIIKDVINKSLEITGYSYEMC